jgi:hypothetical protein
LCPNAARSAVAKQDFRLDVLGQREAAQVDLAILAYIERKACPEAREAIEAAAAAVVARSRSRGKAAA